MNKYTVKIKYGKINKPKTQTQTIEVEAESDMMASMLAINKFKNSNSAYQNMDVDTVNTRRL